MECLHEKDYHKVTRQLSRVAINHLFARSVIERKVTGKVYVDKAEDPKIFYVVHPYGMSLLFGDSGNADFNRTFLDYSLNLNRVREKHEWMQAYPEDWDAVLSRLYGSHMIRSEDRRENKEEGIIELNTRINFTFNREKYTANRRADLPHDGRIVRTDRKLFGEMTGSVIPAFFWDTADDFVKNGAGFSLLCDTKLASTAYSAFIHDNQLELGIETLPEFRGKGFARSTCSALIDYCIEHGYEPVWACRLENTGSLRLAEKLGFEVSKKIPYYRLCK